MWVLDQLTGNFVYKLPHGIVDMNNIPLPPAKLMRKAVKIAKKDH